MSTVEAKRRRKMPPAAISHADEPTAVSAGPPPAGPLPERDTREATTATPIVEAEGVGAQAAHEAVETAADTAQDQAAKAVTAEKESTMDVNTATNETADKAQAMFSDAAERTQGAMDRGQRLFAEWAELGKGNVEAVVESSRIAAKGFETMGRDAAAYAKSSFEGATEAMRTLATVKSPTDFMRLQADFARNAFDAMVAQTSKSTEASLKLAGEVAQPISNRIAVAADKMKVAA